MPMVTSPHPRVMHALQLILDSNWELSARVAASGLPPQNSKCPRARGGAAPTLQLPVILQEKEVLHLLFRPPSRYHRHGPVPGADTRSHVPYLCYDTRIKHTRTPRLPACKIGSLGSESWCSLELPKDGRGRPESAVALSPVSPFQRAPPPPARESPERYSI